MREALAEQAQPVSDDKAKQLVRRCTHRDTDGNWYVDGMQLVHETCFALDSFIKQRTAPQLEDTKGLKMQSKQSNNTESSTTANMQDTKCQCKKLVPLTDEHIKKMAAPLFMSHYWGLCNEFARAIEAAHGIKEEAK
jgi:hypothetical protein